MSGLDPDLAAIPTDTRERLRAALVALLAEGQKVTAAVLRERAKAGGPAATLVARLYREGTLPPLTAPWEDEPEPGAAPAGAESGTATVEELLLALEHATQPSGVAEVARLVGRLCAAGQLDHASGRVVLDAATETRRALADQRATEPPPEDPRKMLLASPEAMQVARCVDWFVCDKRRDRVLAHVAEELEADRIEFPNTDSGG